MEAMEQWTLAQVVPGMEVDDSDGRPVGTVAHVHAVDPSQHAGIVEIKSGLLGLGKHWYVPLSGIQTVTEGCLVLAKPRTEFEPAGWHQKPSSLVR